MNQINADSISKVTLAAAVSPPSELTELATGVAYPATLTMTSDREPLLLQIANKATVAIPQQQIPPPLRQLLIQTMSETSPSAAGVSASTPSSQTVATAASVVTAATNSAAVSTATMMAKSLALQVTLLSNQQIQLNPLSNFILSPPQQLQALQQLAGVSYRRNSWDVQLDSSSLAGKLSATELPQQALLSNVVVRLQPSAQQWHVLVQSTTNGEFEHVSPTTQKMLLSLISQQVGASAIQWSQLPNKLQQELNQLNPALVNALSQSTLPLKLTLDALGPALEPVPPQIVRLNSHQWSELLPTLARPTEQDSVTISNAARAAMENEQVSTAGFSNFPSAQKNLRQPLHSQPVKPDKSAADSAHVHFDAAVQSASSKSRLSSATPAALENTAKRSINAVTATPNKLAQPWDIQKQLSVTQADFASQTDNPLTKSAFLAGPQTAEAMRILEHSIKATSSSPPQKLELTKHLLQLLSAVAPEISNESTDARFDKAAILSKYQPDALPLTNAPDVKRALLQHLQQAMVGPQLLSEAQLQQQLNAALLFNPLQPSMATTAAGTLAVAMQLLLGRLGVPVPDTHKSDKTQKLKEAVQLLELGQARETLKQLASHASAYQAAQLETLAQQKPEQNNWYFQLPLPMQGQSQFAELTVEQRQARKANGQMAPLWHLTLALEVPPHGRLVMEGALGPDANSLQFYTASAELKRSIEKFGVILRDRLKLQGVPIAQFQCTLGELPAHLAHKQSSLLQVKV